MPDAITLETRERLVRLETKMDQALTTIVAVHDRQNTCPARQAYLSRQNVNAEDDLRRERWISRTGWGLALLGGAMNFGPKVVEFLKKIL